jgi:hypothetical protein
MSAERAQRISVQSHINYDDADFGMALIPATLDSHLFIVGSHASFVIKFTSVVLRLQAGIAFTCSRHLLAASRLVAPS